MNHEQIRKVLDFCQAVTDWQGEPGSTLKDDTIAILTASLAEQSEPVARVMYDDDGIKTNNLIDCDLPVGTLLFTHPASKPEKLTDTEINNIADTNSHVGDVAYMHLQEFARAIEQAVLGKCRG